MYIEFVFVLLFIVQKETVPKFIWWALASKCISKKIQQLPKAIIRDRAIECVKCREEIERERESKRSKCNIISLVIGSGAPTRLLTYSLSQRACIVYVRSSSFRADNENVCARLTDDSTLEYQMLQCYISKAILQHLLLPIAAYHWQ